MKISLIDKGSGIMSQFAQAIGATVSGRFIYIPKSKGSGYITGFNWDNGMRMLLRNYHLKENVIIERTNELTDDQDDIVFMLSGVFSSHIQPEKQLYTEQANVLICRHAVSSVIEMPPDTIFGSITIAVPRQYLHRFFSEVNHPVIKSILEAKNNFVFESGISPEIIKTANDILNQAVPENLENYYYRLKCEELLCNVFNLLMQREAVPPSSMHINDIKAIYAIKAHLQSYLNEPPNIALLAKQANMSQPKLRKLFRQTFGKGIFDYYQTARMQEAARLLKEMRLSVSEVGYQLGFTNLSHFSKVFEKHIGMKPKKYSASEN